MISLTQVSVYASIHIFDLKIWESWASRCNDQSSLQHCISAFRAAIPQHNRSNRTEAQSATFMQNCNRVQQQIIDVRLWVPKWAGTYGIWTPKNRLQQPYNLAVLSTHVQRETRWDSVGNQSSDDCNIFLELSVSVNLFELCYGFATIAINSTKCFNVEELCGFIKQSERRFADTLDFCC